MTIDDLLKSLVKHKFYSLNKAYTYIYNKYKIKPIYIKNYKPVKGVNYEGDMYKLEDGDLEIFGTTNKDLNILCEYIIHKK